MIYVHNTTGGKYEVIDLEAKLQIEGFWVEAVIYQKHPQKGNQRFVRTKNSFNEKFTPIEKYIF